MSKKIRADELLVLCGLVDSRTKAQACIGKDTAECKAYNYYNDPLTKLSQQGIESAVGVASNLINKKIFFHILKTS